MRVAGRIPWIAALVAFSVQVSAESLTQRGAAQQPPAAQTPAAQPAPPADYTFPSGIGMLLFYVKPDKTADFEAVVGRINEVLGKTTDPGRKQQAASWRILKSTEPAKDTALYLFFFDPAVVTADYDPIKVLSEGLPADVQGLYDRLKDAVVRVERMGLTKMR